MSVGVRFAILTEDQKQQILANKDAANTKRATNTAVKCIKDYLRVKGIDDCFENLPKEQLNGHLSDFYMEARNKSGELYKKSTLASYRHGIQRHLEEHRTINKIDILKGEEFSYANNAFKSVSKDLKRQGKGAVDHHSPITDDDLQRAYAFVTSEDSAKHLQYKVFLDIMLHFGRRGRENLANLTRHDFAVTTDGDGLRYVFMTRDFATKNHQDDNQRSSDGRMYESKDSDRCPVKSFVKYIRRLNPLCTSLFQVPRSNPIEGIYFDMLKLGHNKIGNFMSDISREAGLSQKYTNHCCRATTVHVLDEAQIPSRHIMTVTGHKSETSLKTYTGKTSNATMKLMSTKIHEKTVEKQPKPDINADIDIENIEPLTDSQSNDVMKELEDFYQDTDNFYQDTDNVDSLIRTIDCSQSAQTSNSNSVTAVSHRSMNIQKKPMYPVPIFNNCSNITINYNFS